MTTQASLFPESIAIAIARLDNQILQLLLGAAEPRLRLTLQDPERKVLRAIRYQRGIANAMPIREIAGITSLDARSIKQAVRTLRLEFRLPIGSTKSAAGGGYYIIVDEQDRAAWVKDVLDQVRAEMAVLRAAAGDQAGLELLGQLRIEIESEDAR